MKSFFYLSRSIIPSKNANSVHVMKMCDEFSRHYADVTLLCQKETELSNRAILSNYGCENTFRLLDPTPSILNKVIRGRARTFIHSMLSFFYLLNAKNVEVYGRDVLAISMLALLMRHKVFFIELHKPIEELNYFVKQLVLYVYSKQNVKFVVISSALKSMCISSRTIDQRDVFVFHDGANFRDSVGNDINKLVNPLEFNVGYTGHLYDGRGIDIILELACLNPRVAFHIVGGNDCDVEKWKKIKPLNNVNFYGYCQNSEVINYLSCFDVLLAPYQKKVSVSGGGGNTADYMSPLKIFEYMSSGKAIICSNIRVLREVLNDSNAMFVTPDDVVDWHEKLNELILDENLRLKLGKSALDDLLCHYTWSIRVDGLVDLMSNYDD